MKKARKLLDISISYYAIEGLGSVPWRKAGETSFVKLLLGGASLRAGGS